MDNYNNQYTVSEVLQRIVDSFKLRSRMNSETIKADWENIAGALVARHTRSLYFDAKILYIEIDDAALKNELIYMKESIIDAVNHRLNNEAINKIVIK